MLTTLRPRIYLGHALTDAPRDFLAHASEIRARLTARYEILAFLGLVAGTAQDVYEWDARCVRTCDAFVAVPEAPSIGLGMELQIAANHQKPTIILRRTGIRVTRMLLGCPNPNQIVADYGTVDEAIEHVGAFVDRMLRA